MITYGQVSVGATATVLATSDQGGLHIYLKNKGSAAVFLGDANVATTTGYELDTGATVDFELGANEALYGIAAAPETVHVIRVGDDWSAYAKVTIDPAGTNNALDWIAVEPGANGNSLTVTYDVGDPDTPLSIEIDGTDITVNVGSDADGNPVSTAQEIIELANQTPSIFERVRVTLTAGNDGTGTVAAVTQTSLSGGGA